jgi:histidinol dehydrogenase
MLKIIQWNLLDDVARRASLQRPVQQQDGKIKSAVAAIIQQVRQDDDIALRALTKQYDDVQIDALAATAEEIADAVATVPQKLRAAIDQAAANIRAFHIPQLPRGYSLETMPGVRCTQEWRAIETVGLYVPGGSAPLFSTVLMLAIPAEIAGCGRRILCTPPQRDGSINPAILYAAQKCGVTDIYKVGGAQAIAAMAYGTASVPKTDKIFGPGNAYVTAAKQMVAQDQAGATIDMPAGPSEVMVIADKTARASFIAADLLSQAEHGADSQVLCVVTDSLLADAVQQAVAQQLENLPRRTVATAALQQSRIIIVDDVTVAVAVANAYAPEHLILQCDAAENIMPQIRHAGSVFIGALTPEAMGDYASGTNHVLPTYGAARSCGGLGVPSFMKSMTVQQISKVGVEQLGPTVAIMAAAEQLEAHQRAVLLRMVA